MFDGIGREIYFGGLCLVLLVLFGIVENLCWVVDGSSVGWYSFGDYGIGIDFGVGWNGDGVEYFGVGIDYYVIF